MNKICLQCNKKFTKKKTTCKKSWLKAIFCSMRCSAKYKGEKSYSSLEKNCIICGKKFIVQNYRKETANYCSSECFHKSRNNGLTDINYRLRRCAEFKKWRELVYERDDWTCRKCFIRGYDLNPHHIQNFSDNEDIRFNIDNGITLCRKCHYDFHSEYGFKNNTLEQLNKFLGVQA